VQKNKFEELRATRYEKEQRNRLPRWALLIVTILAFAGCVAMLVVGDPTQSEQSQCDNYCKTEYGLKGVLIPIITNQKTRPGASQEPYKCTCPRN
jgi:hypothetical protein